MELLPDPLNDRFVPTLQTPPNKPLPESLIYPYKGIYFSLAPPLRFHLLTILLGDDKAKPDWKCVKDFLLREGPLTK